MCSRCEWSGGAGRRDFLKSVLAGSALLAGGDWLNAETESPQATPRAEMGVQRIARLTPVGYRIGPVPVGASPAWVQIDLGGSIQPESIKLFPVLGYGHPDSYDFPQRFRLELSADEAFSASQILVDQSREDYPAPNDRVAIFPVSGVAGRFVRLTSLQPGGKPLMLSKLEVWAGGRDVAEGCPATDSEHGRLGIIPLTRRPRPQGEGVVTDNPGNVTAATSWRPVADRAQTPVTGVTVPDSLFRRAMEDNIGYLLTTFTNDQLVRPFRERAGLPIPAGLPPPIPNWETKLRGSNAGRFLMGAGNTVRWIDHPELRERMNGLVAGIKACRDKDGFIMAFAPDESFVKENDAYTRSWVTHGLIEAGYAGNPDAFPLLRGHYDWFAVSPYLPEILRRTGQGVQGQTASTRLYFTPVGRPEDLQTIQRYFQENYWIEALARRDPAAIWLYPYDHPHNYLITALEPLLDLYRATGQKKYLDAAQGGWDLFRRHWLHVGGSVAICEYDDYPPDSFFLHRHTGELCGSAFWAMLNQRFHRLWPEEEKYTAEIERSIYNVVLANQVGSRGIRYHAALCGHKDTFTVKNSCCEGQGTRMLGALPEFIFSPAADGLYVNLFAPATFAADFAGSKLRVTLAGDFPFASAMKLSVAEAPATSLKLRLRVPVWATAEMPIRLNGRQIAVGRPGTYATLDRVWQPGDEITFQLPIGFKLTPYRGAEPAGEGPSFALEYGPILMALVGGTDERMTVFAHPEDLPSLLKPVPGHALRFAVAGDARHEYRPYWQVADEVFTCYPVIRPKFPWS